MTVNILKSKNFLFKAIVFFMLFMVLSSLTIISGCRSYDNKFDISYFFKTEPEKVVLDFLYSIGNHDAEYIYSNLLLDSDRRNISREKFTEQMSGIFSNVRNIQINEIVYLGYENEMSRVVVDFEVEYTDGSFSHYKKYFFLYKENNKWKIIFDKTFI